MIGLKSFLITFIMLLCAVFISVNNTADKMNKKSVEKNIYRNSNNGENGATILGAHDGDSSFYDAHDATMDHQFNLKNDFTGANSNQPGIEVDSESSSDGINHKPLLIKYGKLSLTIPRLNITDGTTYFDIAPKVIENTIRKFGGTDSYISSMTQHHKNYAIMYIRVPVDNFETLFNALQGLVGGKTSKLSEFGSVRNVFTQIKDVTEEFVDRSARKTALEKTHKQLQFILQNVTSVKDALDVQRELNRISTDIEIQSAKLTHLKRRSEMSDIELTFQEKPHIISLPPKPDPSLYQRTYEHIYEHITKSIDAPSIFLMDLIKNCLDFILCLFSWLIIVILPLGLVASIINYFLNDFYAPTWKFIYGKLENMVSKTTSYLGKLFLKADEEALE